MDDEIKTMEAAYALLLALSPESRERAASFLARRVKEEITAECRAAPVIGLLARRLGRQLAS